jgi:hypothetical protein
MDKQCRTNIQANWKPKFQEKPDLGEHTHTQERHGVTEGATQTYHPLQNVWYRPLGFGGRRGEAEAEAASTRKGKETEEEEAAAVAQ